MNEPDLENSTPLIYAIRLKGHLGPRWFHRFEELKIECLENGETLLTGPVIDQSALFGILNQIRSIGITLLDVECISDG